jgi:molybdate/tungstate transport system substrate-binding protein
MAVGAYVAFSSFAAKPVAAGPLITFSADAYSSEAQALLNGYSSSSGVPVAPVKSGGSFADANQIAAGAPDDVFISASLSAASPAYLKNASADWAVGFASDQMVLAYSNSTSSQPVFGNVLGLAKVAQRSNASSDWNSFFSTLVSGTTKIGISNPVSDPAGLRGWLALEAAGHLYAGGDQLAYVKPLLQSGANVTSTNAAALVAPLEAGQLQFLFIYKSAAISQHLDYVQLDRHINLGDPTLAGFYSQFSYRDSAGTTKGAPIVISITVAKTSASPAAGLEFIAYVVKNAGTLSAYGLEPLRPALLYHDSTPPQSIAQLISQGLIVEAGSLD